MKTETLEGKDKYAAITQMGIAEKISEQGPKEVAIYSQHGDAETVLILACRIPWNVDGWRFTGTLEEREAKVRQIQSELQVAYRDLKVANNGN